MLNYQKTNFISLAVLLVLLASSFFVSINWWWFLLVFIVRFVILFIGSFFISSNFHVKTYCANSLENRKIMALTFDDGPNENTLSILDILKKNNVNATFFCIGKNIEKHPGILKRIMEEGHVVGNHSYSHSNFFDFYRKKRLIAEIRKTDALIESISGKKVQLFRPPYGVTNPSIRRALEVTKHKVIGWNIRSLDGILKDEKIIFARIKKRIAPGGIVLLHDTSHTVAILERLMLYLEENEYKVVSIEELLNIKAYEN
ncbi:Peptidoglycan/xylan/chitin deacetylase, PgdA/CDA1 family [Flavobacterium fluvii]|uniref:Peptidoglycan/xylan/chitin deacetylase, PgdA/CDA1 family n=1 Tax=Flavobacterium fluvii TaxID=468056 RepID=A0A1M5MX26_9FLAO|nr:polysaccharide deacetylase family protein [Flavobacterium fluvii]SHG81874.1 Peptidoglycan/xylan/chitin deacetylase, PgdA/CDA1 family [Flavobacterium fluvii]